METNTSLRLKAELKDLEEIRRVVRESISALQVDPDVVYDIILVVNEMVTNIIEHGYEGQPGLIEIEIEPQGEALIIRLRDEAPPFDPTRVPPPDLTLPLEERPLGGMGVHLTRHFTDRISYRLTPQGQNELTLIKNRVIPATRKEETYADDG